MSADIFTAADYDLLWRNGIDPNYWAECDCCDVYDQEQDQPIDYYPVDNIWQRTRLELLAGALLGGVYLVAAWLLVGGLWVNR